MSKYKTKVRKDLYQEVTDKIIKSLEQGTAPWVKPWSVSNAGMMPANGATGKQYRGINVFILWASPFTDNRWYSYKQAGAKHGMVRRGEKGTGIIFFKPFEIKDDDGEKKTIPLIRGFTVFNHEQIEWEKEEEPKEPLEVTLEEASSIVVATKAVIKHGGDKACYNINSDVITMPELDSFTYEADYWGTALHEVTHWTGHKSRMNRELNNRFGDNAYAFEELVAEMGSAFLCSHAGIDAELQHAEYISSWLNILKKDKKAVFTAAKLAQKAADFVMDFSKSEEKEKAA